MSIVNMIENNHVVVGNKMTMSSIWCLRSFRSQIQYQDLKLTILMIYNCKLDETMPYLNPMGQDYFVLMEVPSCEVNIHE